MKRKLIITAIVALALCAVAVGVGVGRDGNSTPRVNLGVFNTPQRHVDQLPVAFLDGSIISHHFRSADSRLLGSYRHARWYAVPGVHHSICLAGLRADGQTFGPCSDSSTLASRPIVFGYATGKNMGGDHVIVAGLANDGITRINVAGRTIPVRRNAFFLTLAQRHYTLRATGPKVTQTMPLDFGHPKTTK
jgi:hypothetical protein